MYRGARSWLKNITITSILRGARESGDAGNVPALRNKKQFYHNQTEEHMKKEKPVRAKRKLALIQITVETRDALSQFCNRRNPMWKVADEAIRKAIGAQP